MATKCSLAESAPGNPSVSHPESVTAARCSVCLNDFRDPRLLECLHSFCRPCIEQLSVTADSDGFVCPLCRTATKLPNGKVDRLTKDVSVPVYEVGCLACGWENADTTDSSEGASWQCGKCEAALCDHHVITHTKTCSSLQIIKLGRPGNALPAAATETSSLPCPTHPMCCEHEEALAFFCNTCDTAVCGDCITIGGHADHKPIRRLKDVIAERQRETTAKVENMRENLVPRLGKAIDNLDDVTRRLAARTDQVRSEIQAAGQAAITAVETYVQEKLQEVNDIEDSRRKLLQSQHSELKSHLADVLNAIGFSERLNQSEQTSEQLSLLVFALESRLANLERTNIALQPVRHAEVAFKPICDRAASVGSIVGDVLPCLASVVHSKVIVKPGKEVKFPGETVRCVVQLKDDNGDEEFDSQGDLVTTKWLQVPSDQRPYVQIINRKTGKTGQFLVSFVTTHEGVYVLNVLVNGEVLLCDLRVVCASRVRFDPAECDSNIFLSPGRCKATLQKHIETKKCSVLGLPAMRHGCYSWTVRLLKSPTMNVIDWTIGVTEKPLPWMTHNRNRTYSWWGGNDKYCGSGKHVNTGLSQWKSSSRIRFDLDCDSSVLTMTNLDTKEVDRITDLPQEELFPYFSLSVPGETIEIISLAH